MRQAQYINLYRTSVSGNISGWQTAMPSAAYLNLQAVTGSILVSSQSPPANLSNCSSYDCSTSYAYWAALAAADADSGPDFYSRR